MCKTLYHGGESASIAEICMLGLDEGRPFFMTPSRGLARVAASIRDQPGVLRIDFPDDVYDDAVDNGYFVERPYMGIIPAEGIEVKANSGRGVRIVNKHLPRRY